MRILLGCFLLGLTAFGLWAAAKPLLANYYERSAAKALEKQQYPKALAAYQQALRYRPDSPNINLLVARTARRAGNFSTAREHLQRCRELQSGVSEEQQVEGYLLRAQTGEVDEVFNYLLPYLIQEGPLTPLVLESLSRAYMGKYRSDLAWSFLSRWNEMQPTNVEAIFWRGTWYAQQQNTREAAADFRRALELDPERIDIRLTYAEIIRADKQFTEVAEEYRTVLRQSPGNADAILGLAQAYLELGKTNEAREQLAVIPPDKREAAAYLWMSGMVEFRSDRPELAEPLLRRTLESDPRNVDACYNWMLCLRALGRDSEATQARERFEQIEKDQKRLIQLTTQEFHAHPTNAELRCELGEIYLRMGLHERGIYWLHAALKLAPTCRRAHEQLRDHFEAVGGPDSAGKADFHRQQLANLR
ncbi:tetratricopeptide repeat protein [Gemmata sp. G18]|uniref:Tetratricopeptide repeat protein n=1 Tax=Gemmata palustris TaxID=2822762 RepID=A0ABS5C4E2_9BACT|nr:tetratricopeptide repeat protein [Gemmata palustris]MBP3960861.1 tetratricopeptide repeat protein [Gemmata palustris]